MQSRYNGEWTVCRQAHYLCMICHPCEMTLLRNIILVYYHLRWERTFLVPPLSFISLLSTIYARGVHELVIFGERA